MLNLYYTLCQQARIVDISPNQALGKNRRGPLRFYNFKSSSGCTFTEKLSEKVPTDAGETRINGKGRIFMRLRKRAFFPSLN